MADIQDDIANLKPLYAARLAEDLERNAQEQERLVSEVAALQERLETLRGNQVLLANMQQALGDVEGSGGTLPQAGPGVPVPSQGGVGSGAARPEADRGEQSTSERAVSSAGSAVAAPGGRSTPTLRDLVVGYLSEQGRPCSALVVTDALSEAYRDRGIKITVVRSTLEAMVAKGQVRRSKQGKSVFYTAVAASVADKEPVST
ncbi:hypothetical protein [Streptomyces olivochromogenes]|uniref:hypothetical protein n=1 Tax=Streptomyces olivochromogenes TaxID=1963 RepID=UPI001F3F3DA2|nr:hypothetical protein [Streptomyces olivochromogenes]MCF3134670.1 hypothetical protein [Streptomyces olivochromogenes]